MLIAGISLASVLYLAIAGGLHSRYKGAWNDWGGESPASSFATFIALIWGALIPLGIGMVVFRLGQRIGSKKLNPLPEARLLK